MKQLSASCGRAPRRRVHSLSGIATRTGFGLPPPRIDVDSPCTQGVTGVETVMSSLLFFPLLVGWPQHDALGHLTGRDHAPQCDEDLASQRYDHRCLACAAWAFGSCPEPSRELPI